MKKFFPKTFTPARTKLNSKSKIVSRLPYADNPNSKGRNLRQEFDIIMREKRILITDNQLDCLWQTIGTQLLQAPQKSLEELLDTLDIK